MPERAHGIRRYRTENYKEIQKGRAHASRCAWASPANETIAGKDQRSKSSKDKDARRACRDSACTEATHIPIMASSAADQQKTCCTRRFRADRDRLFFDDPSSPPCSIDFPVAHSPRPPASAGRCASARSVGQHADVRKFVGHLVGGERPAEPLEASPLSAVNVSAVRAAVDLIAGMTATLPVSIYQTANGGGQRLRPIIMVKRSLSKTPTSALRQANSAGLVLAIATRTLDFEKRFMADEATRSATSRPSSAK